MGYRELEGKQMAYVRDGVVRRRTVGMEVDLCKVDTHFGNRTQSVDSG